MERLYKAVIGSFDKTGKAQYTEVIIPVEYDGETDEEMFDIIKKGVLVNLHREGKIMNFVRVSIFNLKNYYGRTLGF